MNLSKKYINGRGKFQFLSLIYLFLREKYLFLLLIYVFPSSIYVFLREKQAMKGEKHAAASPPLRLEEGISPAQ